MSKNASNKDSTDIQNPSLREIRESSLFSRIKQRGKVLEEENLSDIADKTFFDLESDLRDLSSKTDNLRIDPSIKNIIDRAHDDAASLSYKAKYEPKMRASPSFFGTSRNLKKKLSMLNKLVDDEEESD